MPAQIWRLVKFAEMLGILLACLSARFACWGDAVYEQQRGLPIGGPLSDLGAALLLGLQEATWRRLAPWRDAEGWSCLRTARQVDAWVAQARYADDVCTVSRALCEPCLESFTREQHPGFPFDTECRGNEGPMRWLDLLVRCGRWPPHLSMNLGERLWLTGQEQALSKYRIARVLGERHLDRHALRSFVRSRLSRWTQVQLASQEVPRALAHSMLVWCRSGYPWPAVRRAWLPHSAGHRLAGHASAVARTLCPVLAARATTSA